MTFRVLVVDSNKVVAKMVKGLLREAAPQAHVDVAVNVWELKRRLKKAQYDLVIADLSIPMDGDDMEKELDRSESSTVYWSTSDKVKRFKSRMTGHVIVEKPTTRKEIKEVLPSILSSAQHA